MTYTNQIYLCSNSLESKLHGTTIHQISNSTPKDKKIMLQNSKGVMKFL
jgi:hypothetical protein